ncbi:unnamed protein product, partial [Prorocentrum cordatum]
EPRSARHGRRATGGAAPPLRQRFEGGLGARSSPRPEACARRRRAAGRPSPSPMGAAQASPARRSLAAAVVLGPAFWGELGPTGAAGELRGAAGAAAAPDLGRRCAARGPWLEPGASLEDNAPRTAPRPGDSELASEVPDALPGAGVGHFHGLLGLRPNGSCCRLQETPLPEAGLTAEERRESHRGFCFNSRASEAQAVDRAQRDVRSQGCRAKHEQYPCDLPTASVVMVFHNEHFVTLVRSVHSVLNQSPAQYLKEVILVDDASEVDPSRFHEGHWRRLREELDEYARALPKVRLVRLGERRGLMSARMEGIWRARGDVIVCLDSHIEATPGWLEPLLSRIAEDHTRVVVPSIDGIDTEDFRYSVFGLGLLSFSWTLAQKPLERLDGSDEPKGSAVMCGGLFAASRRFFLHLGGYDPEMRIWGGEEIEIGFRTWTCGGSIEHVPCSHVGHIWRTSRYWQGSVYTVPAEDLTRNKLRTAEIWMDDYKDLVRLAAPALPKHADLGDLEPRRQLRQRLGCRPFQWFVDNVVIDTVRRSVPALGPDAPPEGTRGAFVHLSTGTCVVSSGADAVGMRVPVAPCDPARGAGSAMSIHLDSGGVIRPGGGELCMAGGAEGPTFYPCGPGRGGPQWRWLTPLRARRGVGRLALGESGRCLEVLSHGWLNFSLSIPPCYDTGAFAQLWVWEPAARAASAATSTDTDPGKEL